MAKAAWKTCPPHNWAFLKVMWFRLMLATYASIVDLVWFAVLGSGLCPHDHQTSKHTL